MAARVFITDDHYMVVEGIRSLLQNEKSIEWMGHATNAASCMGFLQKQQPDVILMDINLPDKSGIDLCKEVKSKYPAIHIVGLSSFNQQSYIQKMMENGASGYVLKNASQEELIEAIEAVMEGRKFLSPEAATIVKNKNSEIPIVTRREKEVLVLIADGLTNNEIAGKLFISTATVDTHRRNLLLKLKARNTAALIRTAIQHQFI